MRKKEVQQVEEQSKEIQQKRVELDASCKKLISNTFVEAWVLKYCVPAFYEWEIEDIVKKGILPDSIIGTELVHEDDKSPVVHHVGSAVEDSSETEGRVTYDLRFSADPGNGYTPVLMDIEVQNKESPGYSILKRGVYYCGRMLSAEQGTVFEDSDYDGLCPVCSVWICPATSKAKSNSITDYVFEENRRYGNYGASVDYHLVRLVFVTLLHEGEDGTTRQVPANRLIEMLDDLLKIKGTRAEKIALMNEKYHIPLDMKGDLEDMCNYSDYVWEDGNKKGRVEGNQEKALEFASFLIKDLHWALEDALRKATDSPEEYDWVKARLANAN